MLPVISRQRCNQALLAIGYSTRRQCIDSCYFRGTLPESMKRPTTRDIFFLIMAIAAAALVIYVQWQRIARWGWSESLFAGIDQRVECVKKVLTFSTKSHNSLHIVPIYPRPVELAEEVNSKLEYTESSEVAEFTLKAYQYKLEKLKSNNKLNASSYIALGKVYFHLHKFQDYLSIMAEGLEKTKDFNLLSSLTMGKMMMYDRKLFNISSFDIVSEWFGHPLNQSKLPLDFDFSYGELAHSDKNIKLRKVVTGSIKINSGLQCNISIGPFRILEDFSYFEEHGYYFIRPLAQVLIEKARIGSLNPEEKSFIIDIFGKEQYAEFEKLVMTAVHELNIDEIPGLPWRLKKDIIIRVAKEENFYSVSNSDLQIYETGNTADEALEEFYSFLSADFLNWLQTKEDMLTENAKQIKETYLEYIDSDISRLISRPI